MAPFDQLGTLALGLLVPSAYFVVGARFVRRVLARRNELSDAPRALAVQLGLPLSPLDGAELAGLLGSGLLPPEARLSDAVRWDAPDAAFSALVTVGRDGTQGVVVATPHGGIEAKMGLADLAHMAKRGRRTLVLPGDLAATASDVVATRVGRRLVVRRPNVRTGEELERLVMCACAILDG